LGILLFFIIIPWQVVDVGVELPTPRTFPRFIAAGITVLGIALFVNGRKKVGQTGLKVYSLSKVEARLVGITMGLLIIYVISLHFLPYIPITIVVLGLLMWFYGQRKWIKIISVSIALPLLIYYSFTYLLQLRLP
jgi:putative tricarboxylic transport membrane protein